MMEEGIKMACQKWNGYFTGKGKLLLLGCRFWALYVLQNGNAERITIAYWMTEFEPLLDVDRLWRAIVIALADRHNAIDK